MKAQFWSFDMIFAIVIFTVSIVILLYVWITLSGQFSLSYGSNVNIMQWQMQSLGTGLLLPGRPTNWDSLINTTNVTSWANVSVGLGNLNGSGLSYNKVNTLVSMSNANYTETKPLLGVGYDYFITIVGSGFNISAGRNPSLNNAFSVQVLTEPVIIGGLPAQMTIKVWTNTTFGVS